VYLDLDRDTVRDTADNCPDYYSRDNRCDADPYDYIDEESGPTPPPSGSAAASQACAWKQISRVKRALVGRVLWKYHLRVDWCWNPNTITSVNTRVWPELIVGCCWRFNRHITYDVRDTASELTYYQFWGRPTFTVFAQGEFELCFIRDFGCPKSQLPWIELTVLRGGGYYKQSGGT
jgi:hypothetical protein